MAKPKPTETAAADDSNTTLPFIRARVVPEDRDRIKVIAAKSRMTTQDMLTEAMNEWLDKRGHKKLKPTGSPDK